MAKDFMVDPELLKDLNQNEYYKRLQQQLRERNSAQAGTRQQENERAEDHDTRVNAAEKVDKTQQARKLFNTEDTVTLSPSNKGWIKTSDGTLEFNTVSDIEPLSSISLKNDGRQILRLFGHKIDFSSRLNDLQESYMQSIIQSKTGNFFMAKYAQFKIGLFGQLMSALGVANDQLKKLQDQAIKGAAEDNVRMMGENIYNTELTELVHGRSKKMRRYLGQLRQIEIDLLTQMHHLGKPEYWSMRRLIEERLKQLKRIREEFVQEREALAYQLNMAAQESIQNEQYQRYSRR